VTGVQTCALPIFTSNRQAALIEIQYIVFDRAALSDTFSSK
jgi:hypothetical protein